MYTMRNMPAQAPQPCTGAAEWLITVGAALKQHRLEMGLGVVRTAELAGLSRVTLYRIERGSPSVTAGAYVNVAAALNLVPALVAQGSPEPASAPTGDVSGQTARIKVSDYPQLRLLAWNLKESSTISAEEALSLYERNWRHVDVEALSDSESALIDTLVRTVGNGSLLV